MHAHTHLDPLPESDTCTSSNSSRSSSVTQANANMLMHREVPRHINAWKHTRTSACKDTHKPILISINTYTDALAHTRIYIWVSGSIIISCQRDNVSSNCHKKESSLLALNPNKHHLAHYDTQSQNKQTHNIIQEIHVMKWHKKCQQESWRWFLLP